MYGENAGFIMPGLGEFYAWQEETKKKQAEEIEKLGKKFLRENIKLIEKIL
jgi:hypothetical protein